jgi:hypothetical protein
LKEKEKDRKMLPLERLNYTEEERWENEDVMIQ